MGNELSGAVEENKRIKRNSRGDSNNNTKKKKKSLGEDPKKLEYRMKYMRGEALKHVIRGNNEEARRILTEISEIYSKLIDIYGSKIYDSFKTVGLEKGLDFGNEHDEHEEDDEEFKRRMKVAKNTKEYKKNMKKYIDQQLKELKKEGKTLLK